MNKKQNRLRRGKRTRLNIRERGTTRLVVNRTSQHIYAQVISGDKQSVTLASASTLEKNIRDTVKSTGGVDAAALVGKAVAERAVEAGVKSVAFDRSGFKYHGRVKTLAESAREAGLQF